MGVDPNQPDILKKKKSRDEEQVLPGTHVRTSRDWEVLDQGAAEKVSPIGKGGRCRRRRTIMKMV